VREERREGGNEGTSEYMPSIDVQKWNVGGRKGGREGRREHLIRRIQGPHVRVVIPTMRAEKRRRHQRRRVVVQPEEV